MSEAFLPDQQALDAIVLDVTKPWTAATRAVIPGAFAARGPPGRFALEVSRP